MYYGIRRRRGFIKAIILIVLALIAMKYFFGITFKDVINSQFLKDVLEIIKMLLKLIWEALTLSIEFIKIALTKAKEFLGGLSTN